MRPPQRMLVAALAMAVGYASPAVAPPSVPRAEQPGGKFTGVALSRRQAKKRRRAKA